MTKKNVLVTGLTFSMVGLMTVCAWAVPQLLNYQGKLTDEFGVPLNGIYNITFKLYNVEIDGSSIWDELQNVKVTDGFYSVQLGANTSFPTDFFENDDLYLELVISGEILAPRQRLTSTAFAMKAENADKLDGLDSTQFAGDTHDHSFPEITGSASDAQIPDDITIDYSTNAGMLDGKYSSDFADAIHGHFFSGITGIASDAQIPMEIARDSELTWGNLSGIPADFADGVDDGTTYSAGTGLDLTDTTFSVEVPLVLSGSVANAGIMSSTNINDTGGYGGYFEATGLYGRGVRGKASNTAGNQTTRNYGGYFEAHGIFGGGVVGKAVGSKGTGVKGEATSTEDYTNVGGEFTAKGTTGIGVIGSALYLGNDTNYGGKFSAGGWTGIGVYGYASRTTDTINYGGYFNRSSCP